VEDDRNEVGEAFPRSVLVLTATLAMAGVAAAVGAGAVGSGPSRLPLAAMLVLLGALAAAGSLQIMFRYREHLEALDLFDAVLAVAIFSLSGPEVLVLAAGAKAISQIVLGVGRTKACFNVAQWMAAGGTGSLCYQALRSGDGLSTRNMAGLAASMVVVGIVNHLAVVLVLSLVSPSPFRRVFLELVPVMQAGWLVGGAVNLALGALLVAALQSGPWATGLFFAPLGMLHWANRGYAEGRADRARLAGLQRATHALGRPIDPRDAIDDFLVEVRSCFEVEVAEVVLVEDGGYRVQRATGSDPASRRTWLEGPGTETLATALLEQGQAVRVGSSTRGTIGELRSREGWRDCVAAPLGAGGEVRGVLCTYNRTGLEGFEEGEIAVLEALAGELSAALEKAVLVDEVLHQALHDALTGLPNRTLFHQRLRQAIAATPPGGRAAVMLVDLDRFKEINDTLGHHSGDLLLQQISERLRQTLRPSDTVARLGGDEFAVVVPVAAGPGGAEAVAQRVLSAFEEPFVVSELTLDVDASIGIALYPDHSEDPAALLQRADVAMYAAKAAQSGFQLYSPAADPYSAGRLALGRELRVAVANGELAVYYQPKTELASGRITGVEALLRWPHPTHGFIPPEEFISLAERTGSIRALTLFVLGEALEQSRTWQRAGLDLDVAVNLSVRSLLDHELAEDVAGLLDRSGVAPARLTLEITETSVMADATRSMHVLSGLHALGLRLSIDDFGTGQSSLSYLKRLAVDEVKIDKSFVTHMATDDNDAVIVRSTIDLGHNLGLEVVAEGVEDATSWYQLVELGCDVAQGYFCSPPLPAAELQAFLAGRPAGKPRWFGKGPARPLGARSTSVG